MQSIKNDLKNNIFSKVYLLYGEEGYLMDYYANMLIEKNTDFETLSFNLLKFSSEIPNAEKVDEFLDAYPFMSEKKVLYVRNSGLFKKATDLQKKFWCDTLTGLSDYNLIIFSENEIDKRNAVYKYVAKEKAAHEFNYMDSKSLMKWVAKLLAEDGYRITAQDAAYLVEICGPSMYNIKNEVDKLKSYKAENKTIEKNDIELVNVKNTENRVFDMVNDIIAKNSEAAFEKLNDLKTLNEEPIKLISIIFKKFSTYKKIYSLKGKSLKEICRLCGIYEKYAKTDINTLKSLSEAKVDKIMNLCMEADFDIKSGKTDKWIAIETIMTEISK